MPGSRPAILVGMAEHRQETIPGAAPADGDAGSGPAPYPVGRYAAALRDFLRKRARVQVIGEVTNLRLTAKAAYFELRDADGAIPCSMWRNDWDRMKLPDGAVRDGTEVVVFGGPDYYPGSATASPSFSFRCMRLRLAGEGDLLAQLAELRRKLSAEGLFEPQKRLPRPVLPRTIGIVTGRGSAAEADLLAGLARRSWAGRAVFAHPPVQDRHAAPKIARALSDLAAVPEVEVIVVARGGGSLADLWAFCDETLCRTVALLRVPVDLRRRPRVGPDADRRRRRRLLLDPDPRDRGGGPRRRRRPARPHRRRCRPALRPRRRGGEGPRPPPRRRRPGPRPPHRGPAPLPPSEDPRDPRLVEPGHRPRCRRRRAARPGAGPQAAGGAPRRRHRRAIAPSPAPPCSSATRRTAAASRAADLRRIAQTLAAHDPDRVLERGYAIVTDAGGEEIVDRRRRGPAPRTAPRPLQRR